MLAFPPGVIEIAEFDVKNLSVFLPVALEDAKLLCSIAEVTNLRAFVIYESERLVIVVMGSLDLVDLSNWSSVCCLPVTEWRLIIDRVVELYSFIALLGVSDVNDLSNAVKVPLV